MLFFDCLDLTSSLTLFKEEKKQPREEKYIYHSYSNFYTY